MRKFNLFSHPNYGFMTGTDKSGEQYLYGTIEDNLIILCFSPEGNLISIDENNGIDLSNYNKVFQNTSTKLEIESDGISIKQFWIDRFETGIKLLPDGLMEFKNNPDASFTLEEQESYPILLSVWEENQKFVLYWDSSDFWVGGHGYVTDT